VGKSRNQSLCSLPTPSVLGDGVLKRGEQKLKKAKVAAKRYSHQNHPCLRQQTTKKKSQQKGGPTRFQPDKKSFSGGSRVRQTQPIQKTSCDHWAIKVQVPKTLWEEKVKNLVRWENRIHRDELEKTKETINTNAARSRKIFLIKQDAKKRDSCDPNSI